MNTSPMLSCMYVCVVVVVVMMMMMLKNTQPNQQVKRIETNNHKLPIYIIIIRTTYYTYINSYVSRAHIDSHHTNPTNQTHTHTNTYDDDDDYFYARAMGPSLSINLCVYILCLLCMYVCMLYVGGGFFLYIFPLPQPSYFIHFGYVFVVALVLFLLFLTHIYFSCHIIKFILHWLMSAAVFVWRTICKLHSDDIVNDGIH